MAAPQSGSVRDAKRFLAEAIVSAKKARAIIEFIADEGRMLMKDEDLHQLQDMVLILGNDAATMDSWLHQFMRLGVGSDRFLVTNKKQQSK